MFIVFCGLVNDTVSFEYLM